MAFFGTAVESPLTATLKRPISSVPKVAVVEGFNCSHYPGRENCSILNTKRERKAVRSLTSMNITIVIFLDFQSAKQGLPLVDSWSRGLD